MGSGKTKVLSCPDDRGYKDGAYSIIADHPPCPPSSLHRPRTARDRVATSSPTLATDGFGLIGRWRLVPLQRVVVILVVLTRRG